jgi:hypothetical protein
MPVGDDPLYRLLKATIVGWPYAPLARVPAAQVKLLKVLASVMLFPAVPRVVALTVTVVVPPELAVTPTVPPLRVIAAARFVAVSVSAAPMEKFVPESEASTPPARWVAVVHAAIWKFGLDEVCTVMLFPADPGVVAVIVTAALLLPAVTPTYEPQYELVIRLTRRLASVLAVKLLEKLPVLGFPADVHTPVPVLAADSTIEFDPLVIVSELPLSGSCPNVPVALAALGVAVRTSVPPMVTVWPPLGWPVNDPVWLAAAAFAPAWLSANTAKSFAQLGASLTLNVYLAGDMVAFTHAPLVPPR